MFGPELVSTLYEAASIQRWNDHIRPVEFTELDKQAHKAVIALLLAKFEEEGGRPVDWIKLIEGQIFELLQRAKLTDIKPPIFHRMMARKGRELNEWVIKKLAEALHPIEDGKFLKRFESYLMEPEYAEFEKRILQAAHYLATLWEFNIIYRLSPANPFLEETRREIENKIEDHYDLVGVQRMELKKKSFLFADLCGQLRFQQRWAQSPRVPRTSVLGHMLIVAILTYLSLLEVSACSKRLRYSFYSGLFHDLPEIVTRDIISPVKKSVAELEEIIQEYEIINLEEKILPLLPARWHNEFKYWLGIHEKDGQVKKDEFRNRIIVNGQIKFVSFEEINREYNQDRFSPVDGEIIRICDHLAAFVEAVLSIRHGITSPHLEEARRDLLEKYEQMEPFWEKLDFSRLFKRIGEQIN